MDYAELDNRFDYHQPSSNGVADNHEAIRDIIGATARQVIEFTPSCREQSLALTKLEEAMFWANAAIARNQFGSTED